MGEKDAAFSEGRRQEEEVPSYKNYSGVDEVTRASLANNSGSDSTVRMTNNNQKLFSFAWQFVAAGLMVGVSTWDVHRHIQANSVPVTREQAEGVSAYKRELKRQMDERPLKFVESYLAGGGGSGGGGGGRRRRRWAAGEGGGDEDV